MPAKKRDPLDEAFEAQYKGSATEKKADAPGAKKSLNEILAMAGRKALGGGLAGALAMVIQVGALMWMRTTINFQHSKGMGTLEAMQTLYAEGGLPRFYQGMWAALFQAPLSRFGDTAANAGMNAALEGVTSMPAGLKIFCASVAAALFRILITPIDTLKTTLQVQGTAGMSILSQRIEADGLGTLYSGALGSSFATLVGHYPWFFTHNSLQAAVPQATGVAKQIRSALIGFCSSFASDVISNGVRVVKTAKQTATTDIGYLAVAQQIVAADGVTGLLFRGLTTKILSNGLQAMLFTICWRYFEQKIKEWQENKQQKKCKNN